VCSLDDLVVLVDEQGHLFLRWSDGPEADGPGYSLDDLTGVELPGAVRRSWIATAEKRSDALRAGNRTVSVPDAWCVRAEPPFRPQNFSNEVQIAIHPGEELTVCYQALWVQPGMEAPGVARHAVRTWLGDWGLQGVSAEMLLVVSELVTNAAVHAQTFVELSLSVDKRSVQLAVRDGDPRSPLSGESPSSHASHDATTARLAESGRGLSIVGRLADAWGVEQVEGGKRVWARISIPPP
jgi:anti-sigma regulatory factor (Ser/Thr protein kinase)